MNRSRLSILLAVLLSLHIIAIASAQPPAPAAPVGSAFTYQGRLRTGNTAITNRCDFQFSLWNAASAGSRIGGVLSTNNIQVTDGRFNVTLDFGAAAFDGQGRWLLVAVRCPTGVGSFTTLSPRQALAASPYATRATTAGSVAWASITGKPAGFADNVDNTGLTVPLNLSGSTSASIIYALSTGSSGTGIQGEANNGTAAYGVWGLSSDGRGVVGSSITGLGLAGFSDSNIGVWGVSTTSRGVEGFSSGNFGVAGFSETSVAVFGNSRGRGMEGQSTDDVGVAGFSDSNYGIQGVSESSIGVAGFSNSAGGYGVYGDNRFGGYAGYFFGDVRITGSCCAAAASTFQIDHPLDPANKYLAHAGVESSEMKNIYDGVATIGADGTATVTLPDWFEALNQEFRYQLTCIGGFAQVYIAEEIQGNRFVIGGGAPGLKVSWQVTGVRHDPYAAQHRLQIEEAKPAEARGTYLYPQGYGQPASKGEQLTKQPGSQSESRPHGDAQREMRTKQP